MFNVCHVYVAAAGSTTRRNVDEAAGGAARGPNASGKHLNEGARHADLHETRRAADGAGFQPITSLRHEVIKAIWMN